MVCYEFDASFPGLLTAVFEYYSEKPPGVQLLVAGSFQKNAFDTYRFIHTDIDQAKRVWQGLKRKLNGEFLNHFYQAYLSEQALAYQQLFDFARYVFDHAEPVYSNYGHPDVLSVFQTSKKVSREKHRMEAFVRFQKAQDGLYYAFVDPDFDVLVLIKKHFRDRYADRPWLIYDERRNYGIYYDLHQVLEVRLETKEAWFSQTELPSLLIHDSEEALYSKLWQTYFKSTNIPERKNTSLQLKQLPKRYWKYLNEK